MIGAKAKEFVVFNAGLKACSTPRFRNFLASDISRELPDAASGFEIFSGSFDSPFIAALRRAALRMQRFVER